MNNQQFEDALKTNLLTFLNQHRSSIEVLGDTWSDDGILCFKGSLATFTVDLMWAGIDLYSAWKYARDSNRAFEDLVDHLEANLSNVVLDDLDRKDKWRYDLLLELGFTTQDIGVDPNVFL